MVISSELYIHDLDKKAFQALNAFPRFIKLWEAYISNFDEKAAKIDFMSKAIRLSDNQMPEIYNLLPPVCDKLGIAVPELYYIKSKEMNAATAGVVNPYVYVTSQLVEKIPKDLIASVLAHECGHIACKHYMYHLLAIQLIKGIDMSPLSSIPGVRRFLTPTLVKALLFWDRCSELSADRAAALCDGNVDKTIDMLLKIHGYGDDINRDAFLKQAMDLREFVNDSKSNKLIEMMLVQDESHPRLATRAFECYEWSRSGQFLGILNGVYTIETKQAEVALLQEEQEVITADVSIETTNDDVSVIDIDAELERVNSELVRYTSQADKTDYALAVFSGVLCGAIDSLYVGEMKIKDGDIALSHEHVKAFILRKAKDRGYKGDTYAGAINKYEREYKVAQDNIWKKADISVSAMNHHLADLAHHPTPLGLVSAIAAQFLRVGSFVSRDGVWHFIFLKPSLNEVISIVTPAVITGVLRWLVSASIDDYEEETGEEVPETFQKLLRLIASTPIIIEVVECAENWYGHLISDMGGSSGSARKGKSGMGIPGIFLSLLYEISAMPILKDSGLPFLVNDLYENQKKDLRFELTLYKALGKQAIPVILNEIIVRSIYFVSRLVRELKERDGIKGINWTNVAPVNNRTVDRMLTVATMTFTVADTADAAIRDAYHSAGLWVLFSGRFFVRFNYVGAGRAAVAIVKEISGEMKEAQLIHEKMILTEAKTVFVIQRLEEYKAKLEERLSNYLAEDIEAFITGFDYMAHGLATGDSDLFIKGNVVIQRVLGREPQFTNQEEFDALMDSDVALQL